MNSPDLITCVFHLKKQEILQLIKEKDVFGRFYGDVYTIEYQKQDLPYMHLLLFLHLDDQIFHVAKINQIFSAELPTEKDDPTGKLFCIVSSVMLYSPCSNQNLNAPYIKRFDYSSPQYTKRYLQKFLSEKIIQENGYSFYSCQNNGWYYTILDLQNHTHTFQINNCWIISYNPFLSCHFKAHINIKVCSSI